MRRSTSPSLVLPLSSMLLLAASGCGSSYTKPKEPIYKSQTPIATAVSSSAVAIPSTIRPIQSFIQNGANDGAVAPIDQAVATDITLLKSEIFGGREFLYGADLQYSTSHDEGMDLYNQSLALGHEIVRFEQFRNSLRILADSRYRFESDVNHPSRLIQELPIVSETPTSLTVRIDRASPTLVTVAGASNSLPARTSWVRAVEYVSEGNYLLIQSSIETAGGDIFEFYESLFPRETLVPENFEPIWNDPSLEEWAERFRFLSNGSVFANLPGLGRLQTAPASRYVLSGEKPIEWYVTPNVPDEYIDMVRHGIEGWNRYSQQMWERDFIRFAGRLPEGISIGDPRYNVVNWDSVSEAGAAYEMQASDPLTGVQSHSLIYLPRAWVNIGKGFWDKGQLSEAGDELERGPRRAPRSRTFLGRLVQVQCRADASAHLPAPEEMMGGLSSEEFGKELLKGTLFHEVGHALGLDHNFKGSLSFDGDETLFSTSIMDYNQFHLEQKAFESLDSSYGPLLEYDRQILSALYNEGGDIFREDDWVPACNDQEADQEDGFVDPLCIRYDAGADPTARLVSTRQLIDEPEFKLDRSLSLDGALNRVLQAVNEDPVPEAESGFDALENRLERFVEVQTARTLGTVNFYFNSGAQSLAAMSVANVKSLLNHQSDLGGSSELIVNWRSFEVRYDLQTMRRRVFETLEKTLSSENLPEKIQGDISAIGIALRDRVYRELLLGGRESAEAEVLAERLVEGSVDLFKAQLMDGMRGSSVLGKTRKKVLAVLTRHESVPYSFERGEDAAAAASVLDYEAAVVQLLKKAIVEPFSSLSSERGVAIASLVTFKGTENGDSAIRESLEKVKSELRTARSAAEREQFRAWIQALNR